MKRERAQRKFRGANHTGVRKYEVRHREIARQCASEGMVLLKNEENILPLALGKVALYGAGATMTVKGGTGSGDVNQREVVSIRQGLENAGYTITSGAWLDDFDKLYHQARLEWKNEIWEAVDKGENLFMAYTGHPFSMPAGSLPEKTDTDTAIYVISRIAGEGKDRYEKKGDYRLSTDEEEVLKKVCSLYNKVLVVINSGSLIDLSFLDQYVNIHGLLYIVQPGMEAGNAFADVVSGKVAPSGKLTDSWPFSYGDYPNGKSFSHNNGNVDKEYYDEGIYVGYRYFDSFQVPVRYSFGYGMSYTAFSLEADAAYIEQCEICQPVKVTNQGGQYSGREVVQVYISCPAQGLEKEFRRLAGFGKTAVLAPGESQELMIHIPLKQLASYDDNHAQWIVEKGKYGIWMGNSLGTAALIGIAELEEAVVLEKTTKICPLQEALKELSLDRKLRLERETAWLDEAFKKKLPVLVCHFDELKEDKSSNEDYDETMEMDVAEIMSGLTEQQMVRLVIGEPSKGQGSTIGAAGVSVPGSAGETSSCAENLGLAEIVLADGPAGLRLQQVYHVIDGILEKQDFEASLEGGFLAKSKEKTRENREASTYYQYCTAIPVGTLLAQTWDEAILDKIGEMIAEEMLEFGVTLWLAPGMNIHRNPLCGRNFEYFSEDPYLTGKIAASITRGVQRRRGVGTTIKHFACNNLEDNRQHNNSIISERTLREVYLRGFEIAIKESRPMAIMTSYNMINGIHTANSYDLCSEVARKEWGFDGIIMTDWLTTQNDPQCTASGCIQAGNDLIMPGLESDLEDISHALKNGTLEKVQLRECVERIVRLILKSTQYA